MFVINSNDMTREEKTELARTLYILTDKTQKEICKVVCWSEQTFSAHKQKGHWDELKAAKTITKQNIIALLHSETLRIIEEAKKLNRSLSSKEIDSISKLAASIERLEKKVSAEMFIEVFEHYNKWLMGVNSQFAQENNNFQDQFLHQFISR